MPTHKGCSFRMVTILSLHSAACRYGHTKVTKVTEVTSDIPLLKSSKTLILYVFTMFWHIDTSVTSVTSVTLRNISPCLADAFSVHENDFSSIHRRIFCISRHISRALRHASSWPVPACLAAGESCGRTPARAYTSEKRRRQWHYGSPHAWQENRDPLTSPSRQD